MSSFSFSPSHDENFSAGQNSNEQLSNVSFLLAFVSLAVTLFGLAMLYSTSYGKGNSLFIKQIIWASSGIGLAIGAFAVGYKRIMSYSFQILILASVMLIVPRFFHPINGAYRWIKLPGGLSIQPSEFAKIALILFLVNYCAARQSIINSLNGFIPALTAMCAVAGLVFIGKDLGTAFLICCVSWIIFFSAGVRLTILTSLPSIFLPLTVIYLKFFDPERWSRISSFLDPEKFADENGYQLWNSLMALGSGHWTGLGFTESKLKAFYLPEAHTDFILSIVGEELGIAAMILVLASYFIIFISSIYISSQSKDRRGMLLASSLASMITLQALVNLGVISGIFPTKGMPAPFISYGGSNILMCAISVGLILSVAKNNETNDNERPLASIKIRTDIENENIE
jgi:cell division protein FtsW